MGPPTTLGKGWKEEESAQPIPRCFFYKCPEWAHVLDATCAPMCGIDMLILWVFIFTCLLSFGPSCHHRYRCCCYCRHCQGGGGEYRKYKQQCATGPGPQCGLLGSSNPQPMVSICTAKAGEKPRADGSGVTRQDGRGLGNAVRCEHVVTGLRLDPARV